MGCTGGCGLRATAQVCWQQKLWLELVHSGALQARWTQTEDGYKDQAQMAGKTERIPGAQKWIERCPFSTLAGVCKTSACLPCVKHAHCMVSVLHAALGLGLENQPNL